ncbi:hypothetical protein LK09_16645 [Microbacterium mangrovi]|uniref:Uncharacterized protein n=1 Tax=Microbacterium mangrovi TaxID=1348253 RepID=A0A0B1ZXP1_9MICO|nr:hypothetical protein [Microbacterium mangrovi]KHK95995.1 hypothetical protein LK09_16645 [Microbacterium mangrovi]
MSTDERSEGRRVLRAQLTVGQLSWITILVLIGLVQVIRAQPFDALFFATAVLVTTMDATGILTAATQPRRVSARVLVVVGAVAATALAALPRHGPAMVTLMLLLGAAVLLLAWPGSAERMPWSRGIRSLAWCWGIILVIGCLWELFAFILSLVDPRAPAPALSDLLDPMLGNRLGQAVFAGLWVLLGIWLVRRVGRR